MEENLGLGVSSRKKFHTRTNFLMGLCMKTNRTDPTIEIVNGREKKKSSKITPSLSLSRHSFCVRKKKIQTDGNGRRGGKAENCTALPL
jgi:hypothetical protein